MNTTNARKSTLTPARCRLIDLMSRMQFGRITALDVQGGDPSFGVDSQVLTEVLFGKSQSGTAPTGSDFALKREVVEFLEVLDRVGNGRLELVDIRNGLPFRVQFDDSGSYQARAARQLTGIA